MNDIPVTNDERDEITFHYVKSNFFRVMHVDGVIGDDTPTGFIHMTVYSERPALPQKSKHKLTEDGALGEPAFTGKEGFVREMDADLIFDRDTAIAMRDWLDDRIQETADPSAPDA